MSLILAFFYKGAEQGRVGRLPLNCVVTMTKVQDTVDQMVQEYERSPHCDELATALDLKPKNVWEALAHVRRALSRDAPTGA